MTNTKTNNKKTAILAVAALAALLIVFALVYRFAAPKATAGAKAITIEVVNDAAETTTYEVHTDAEFLRQALEEAEGLTVEGTESEYGLMITTVNGVLADYNSNGAYWAIFVNGEYGNYSVDAQPVTDGETYSLVYTK